MPSDNTSPLVSLDSDTVRGPAEKEDRPVQEKRPTAQQPIGQPSGNREPSPTRRSSFGFHRLGCSAEGVDIVIDNAEMKKLKHSSKTITEFVRRLMPHIFTKEEMIQSSWAGGEVKYNKRTITTKHLDFAKREVILATCKAEYPDKFGEMTSAMNNGSVIGLAVIREAVNAKCRQLRNKAATVSMKV